MINQKQPRPGNEMAFKKNLFVPGSLVTLATLVVLFFDGHILVFVRRIAPEPPDKTLLFISEWGLYIFYLIFAGLLVYALLRKRGDLRKLCIAWVKAEVIFGFAVVRVMKIIFGRARPPIGSEFSFFSLHDRYNSFPSGHAADAFVSGIFLFYLLRHSKCRFVPLLYALVMALLRVIVYEHHPSDVTMGMAIGILGAGLVLFIDKPERTPA